MKKANKCCICGNKLDDEYGNNPYPVKETGRCCNACNATCVIPARLKDLPVETHDKLVVKPDWEAEYNRECERHHHDLVAQQEEFEKRMIEQEHMFHDKIVKLQEEIKFKDDIIKSVLNIRS